MSIRSIFTGRMGLFSANAVARTSDIGSQGASAQLARLYSSAVRPSCAIQNQDLRPHVRAFAISQSRPAGLRAQSTSAAPKDEVKLDWDSFFKLRASRRRYSLSSSIISSIVSTSVGVQVLSSQDLESLGTQVMGLDPFVVLGMATAACGAIGWLVGPAVGNGVWGLIYRRYKPSVAKKEKEFFDRIKRFRVDPSTNSIANPVPDYYGEKIGSVQGYRQWLKDQRAYNRKRRNFIV
ncbi:Presequence translocated-associated motor subunit pam17 [Penicillium rolfsii]|nr:Presequence translocated-associated motor subunit pam17 [Penicillium rolfsii]